MASTVEYIANPFIVAIRQTDGSAGTWAPPAKCRVLAVVGVMTGAGAAGDTIALTDGTNVIMAAVDVATKVDTDVFLAGKIDDAQRDLIPGTDVLTSVTVSAATADLFVLLGWIA